MQKKPLTKEQLQNFFSVTERGLSGVLKDLKIYPVNGKVWPVVIWRALCLAPDQKDDHRVDLSAPLLSVNAVAKLAEVVPETVHRWNCGKNLPRGRRAFPKAIDLSNGRKNARMNRWRKSEVQAWIEDRPIPRYARIAPEFGSLKPQI